MSQIMVLENTQNWRPGKSDAEEMLREVYERFHFLDERDVEKDEDQYIIISAKTDDPPSEATPIYQQDFFANTLNPVAAKVKELLYGRKPALKSFAFDGRRLVFIYTAS